GGAENSPAADVEQAPALAHPGIEKVSRSLVHLGTVIECFCERIVRQEGQAAGKSLFQLHISAVITRSPVTSGRAHAASPQGEEAPAQDGSRIRWVGVKACLVTLAVVDLVDSVRSHVAELQQDIRKHLPLYAEIPLLDGWIGASGDIR